MTCQRPRARIEPEELVAIDPKAINPAVYWRGKVVPFAQCLRVFYAEMLLPALDKKLRVRHSNRQGLRIRARQQFASSPRRSPQHGIDDRSMSFRPHLHRLMDSCVFSRFKKQKLI